MQARNWPPKPLAIKLCPRGEKNLCAAAVTLTVIWWPWNSNVTCIYCFHTQKVKTTSIIEFMTRTDSENRPPASNWKPEARLLWRAPDKLVFNPHQSDGFLTPSNGRPDGDIGVLRQSSSDKRRAANPSTDDKTPSKTRIGLNMNSLTPSNTEERPQNLAWQRKGYLMEVREQGRPSDKHSRKICRKWESAGVVFTEWPVTGVRGDVAAGVEL